MEVRMSHCSKIIRKDKVLENISLEFISGKVYGLRGVNGSGKTMLLRLLCGLIYASEGEVVIDGQVLGKDISFPPSVGVLIENPGFLPEFSGYDNLYAISQRKSAEMRLKQSCGNLTLIPGNESIIENSHWE